ncbi:MAG: bifunctional 2-polyprenyl-6-hydroxyphenol methylase/3-demethylubiquinol 3-O-methyltransferase UbiG [Pelagibacterales bacterium]|nr:bifunctional 2-polyprenyl-6-hydroxyphenol methylase/3-demethylubiquinol 3-O-methyltransferase UbiG [Pelagibacterales bacterium]
MTSTINQQEVEKFSRIAEEWWDESGKFKPLHKFNPIRISFIRKEIVNHFKLDENSITPFTNIKIVDIGCGGGLVAEPFCKMNASVTAIDASDKNIAVAKIHAEKSGLKINYLNTSAENLAKNNEKFDVVLALEVIEHVDNVEEFIKSCSSLVKPNGIVFVATMNRNLKSLALAKIAVEYVLKWLPKGTHDWKKFLKPSEINNLANSYNLSLKTLRGFHYNIFNDSWSESENLDVNYIAVFNKK